jgi:hypothetical protein
VGAREEHDKLEGVIIQWTWAWTEKEGNTCLGTHPGEDGELLGLLHRRDVEDDVTVLGVEPGRSWWLALEVGVVVIVDLQGNEVFNAPDVETRILRRALAKELIILRVLGCTEESEQSR